MITANAQAPVRRNKSILLIGPPGGGKTTLALQFPNVHVLDCDMNLEGPDRYLREIRKLPLTYTYDMITFDDEGRPIPVENCFDRLMVKLNEAASNPDSKTVVIDSLTLINEFIIRKVLKLQKKTEMDARDWIPFKSHFLELLVGRIRRMPKHTICIVHESINWTTNPTNIMDKTVESYEPSVQGSIVDYFGGFFTDMWRCESYLVAGQPVPKTEFKLTTVRTSKSDLKNSSNMPPIIKNPTFEELNKYMKI